MKPNIKDLTFKEFEAQLLERHEPAYRIPQVWQWVYQKHATAFGEMTNVPASLRAWLDATFILGRIGVVRRQESRDGTVKFLFALADGATVESVLIPEVKRLTLCISTQVGCGFGCAFCATATLGLKRNLTSGEIVDQVLEASRSLAPGTRISNVVLMGMGEPLANYHQTIKALEIMTDTRWGIGISPRRITLSTVGLVPQVRRLMDETNVNLAISLHAPTDAIRSRLMPVNRKYSLQELIDCCRALPIPRRKRITFEYVLLRGVNDSDQCAHDLCRLLSGIRCKVNLIPFNPHPDSEFQRPDAESVEAFQQALAERDIQVNVRRPRGDDIAAACGQLQGEVQGKRRAEFVLAAQA
jgi:23S rRNA (adenine2503-C2)-methyltransferase